MRDKLEISFIIISPEPNIGRLKGTIRSIKNNYSKDAKIICSVVKSIKKAQIEEMRIECPTHRGGTTITSLINSGFKNSASGWNLLIMEGAWLPKSIYERYSRWVSSDSDILFPLMAVYDRQGIPIKILNSFHECTLNGMMIKKEFFEKVGKFSENSLEISRIFWGLDALEKGAIFKSVLGVKIC